MVADGSPADAVRGPSDGVARAAPEREQLAAALRDLVAAVLTRRTEPLRAVAGPGPPVVARPGERLVGRVVPVRDERRARRATTAGLLRERLERDDPVAQRPVAVDDAAVAVEPLRRGDAALRHPAPGEAVARGPHVVAPGALERCAVGDDHEANRRGAAARPPSGCPAAARHPASLVRPSTPRTRARR